MFAMKYGKEFVAAATELRPGCRVNRPIIEKLSARPPSVIMKLRTMKEIAEEHGVVWDSSNTEMEFSKLPADVLDGPNQFIGATGIAMIVPEEDETQSILLDTANFKSSLQEDSHSLHNSKLDSKLGSSLQCNDSFKAPVLPPFLVMPKSQEETTPSWFYSPPRESSASRKLGLVLKRTHSRTGSEGSVNLQDIIEAAEAAAESAEKAAQAAREVANLARSRIYPKSPGQPKNGGMYLMCSKVEQESSFDIKSKPYFTEETGNMQNEFQSMAEHYENSQKNQGEEDTGESGLYDNAKDVQAGEPVHFGQFERGKGSIIDSFEDDNYNAVSISYPQALEKEGKDSLEDAKLFTSAVHLTPAYLGSVGESTEGHQSFYDALGPGEAEMRNHPQQPQRLPSLEDDPFFTYPNLFSRHSGA